MNYAVVVYFDEDTRRAISQITKDICGSGINLCLLDLGIRPHITLGMFKKTREKAFLKWLSAFAKESRPFSIKFSSIGIFPLNPSVLYLSAVPDESLLVYHKRFHDGAQAMASAFDSHYLPGNWVPHCTLAIQLNESDLNKATDVAVKAFKPITATVTHIGIAQTDALKELATYKVGEKVKLFMTEKRR